MLEEYFSHSVGTSWLFESPLPIVDDMSLLVFKLKRLKVVVKGWEKVKVRKKGKEFAEIKRDILSLFSSCPSGILSKDEAMCLATLKIRKKKYLAHEFLTWNMKSRAITGLSKGMPIQNVSTVMHLYEEISMPYGP